MVASMVRVRFLAQLKSDVGTSEAELNLEEQSVIDILNYLAKEYKKPFLKLLEDDLLIIMLNNRVLDENELNAKVNKNDIITLMPPITGGA